MLFLLISGNIRYEQENAKQYKVSDILQIQSN